MKKWLIAFIAFSILLQSCTKEGSGGKASISGTVYEKIIDHNGNEVETRVAQETKVYIAYGESGTYNDDTETNEDGVYVFNYLTKGKYTVAAYSDCDSCDTEQAIVKHNVDVTSRGDDITQDITINKFVKPDDGSATITGTLLIQKYLGTTPFGDPYVAQNTDVFIVYDTDDVYFERIKTGADGKFAFSNLIIGNYKVYAYSICDTCSTVLETKEVAASVINNGETINVGNIIVETP